MLTTTDINRIVDSFTDLVYTKDEMDQKFSALQTTVDGLVKPFAEMKSEIIIINSRLLNIENRLGNVENRLGGVENRLGGVEDRLGIPNYK